MNISKIIPAIAALIAVACIAVLPITACQNQETPRPQDPASMQVDNNQAKGTTSIVEEPLTAPSENPFVEKKGLSAKMQAAYDAAMDAVSSSKDSVAVSVIDLSSGEAFDINGDKQFASGSIIKLAVLAKFMELVDAGEISLDETHTVSGSEIVGGTGVIAGKGAGTTLTMDQLANYMISESDNVATNILINRIGMEAINDKAKELGLEQTSLSRLMMDTSSGKENYTTSNEAALLLKMIENRSLASDRMCNKAIEYLCAQSDDDALAAGLPSGVRLGNKTGSINSNRHDCGIVFTDKPYVIAVFTNGLGSPNALIASVSKAVYEKLNG